MHGHVYRFDSSANAIRHAIRRRLSAQARCGVLEAFASLTAAAVSWPRLCFLCFHYFIRIHRLPHRLWSCCRIFLHSAPACDFMHSATRGSVFHGSGPSSSLQLPCRRFRPASSIAASVAAKRHSAGFKTRATAFAASFNVASFNAASFIQCRRPSLCHHRAPFTPPVLPAQIQRKRHHSASLVSYVLCGTIVTDMSCACPVRLS